MPNDYAKNPVLTSLISFPTLDEIKRKEGEELYSPDGDRGIPRNGGGDLDLADFPLKIKNE